MNRYGSAALRNVRTLRIRLAPGLVPVPISPVGSGVLVVNLAPIPLPLPIQSGCE